MLNLPNNIPLHFVAMQQTTAEELSDIWHGSAYEVKVWNWIPPWGRKCPWHSPTLVEHLWTWNGMWEQWCSGWYVSAMVTVTVGHHLWCRFVQVRRTGSCSLLVKMHSQWWWLYWKIVFCSWNFSLSNSIIVLFVADVVSMKINRRHYFWSNIHLFYVFMW